MKLTLPHLPDVTWLVLCLALSVIGSLLAVLGFAILNGINLSNPYFLPANIELLVYFVGYSLLVNILGAAALMLAFAIRKRMRAN